MNRFRTVSAILLALALVAVVPTTAEASGDCTYNFSFSRTSSGDVRITATASCPGAVQQTSLSVSSPTPSFAFQYGSVVSTVIADAAGSQQYCASAVATYWESLDPWNPYSGSNLVLDEGSGTECATF